MSEENLAQEIERVHQRLDVIEKALSELSSIDDRVTKIGSILQSEVYIKSVAGAVSALLNPPPVKVVDVSIKPWDATNTNADTCFQGVVVGVGEQPELRIFSYQEGAPSAVQLSHDVEHMVLDKVFSQPDVIIGNMYSIELMQEVMK